MAGYTVKELAEICDVSQTAIKKQLAKLNETKVAGKWQPSQQGCEAIFKHYGIDVAEVAQSSQSGCATSETTKETENEITYELLDSLNQTIETLRKELDIKNKQIEDLTNANQKLTDSITALSASTALNSASVAKDKLLVEPIENKEETKSKKGFLKKILGLD